MPRPMRREAVRSAVFADPSPVSLTLTVSTPPPTIVSLPPIALTFPAAGSAALPTLTMFVPPPVLTNASAENARRLNVSLFAPPLSVRAAFDPLMDIVSAPLSPFSVSVAELLLTVKPSSLLPPLIVVGIEVLRTRKLSLPPWPLTVSASRFA